MSKVKRNAAENKATAKTPVPVVTVPATSVPVGGPVDAELKSIAITQPPSAAKPPNPNPKGGEPKTQTTESGVKVSMPTQAKAPRTPVEPKQAETPPIHEDQVRPQMKNDLNMPIQTVMPRQNTAESVAPLKATNDALELDRYYKFEFRDEKCVGKVLGFNQGSAQIRLTQNGQPLNLREFPLGEIEGAKEISKDQCYNISLRWNHYADI